ncbi:helix-turn-helix transcriptional regulator [bacterium]|nr:helix-turn-helix transcriptional regulator [bacterium]MBU1072054.1 helix-turn-helix transcriptional regulator [bacterium]MBU1676708.1 helix-turn-helix transcriptional regulator [bacterium]
MKPTHDIISHLRRHRLLADEMTQQELADRIGVTRQTILSIEKGKYSPSVGLALRLAEVFGVAVEDLFELEEGTSDV